MHGRLLGRIWGTMLSDVGCVRITQWCGWLLVFLGIVHIPAGPAGAQDIVWRVRAHDSPMWGHPVQFSRDGTMLVSGAAGGTPGAGSDNSVKLWSTSSGQLVYWLRGNRGPAHGLSISPDNRYVASGSNWFHGQITIWSAQAGTFLRELQGHRWDTWDTEFSPDGVYLASCGGGSQVGIWRTSDWQNVAMLSAPGGRVFCVTWSADGQFVAAGSESGNIYIWHRETWALWRSWHAHSVVNHISFSEDGEYIVTSSSEGTAKIWRLSDGALLHTFSHSSGIGFARLVANNAVIVLSGGNTVRFYSVEHGTLLAEWNLDAPIGGFEISYSEEFIAVGLNTPYGSDLLLVRNPFASSNRPPAVPTLIAPAHNARVASLPTFQLRASDPDGDRVRFEVQVWQGNDVRTFFVPASGYVASDQVASGTPPQPLPAGTWRWKARTWDERGGVSSWSGEWSFVVDTRAALTATPTTLPANNQSTSTLTLTYRYSDGAPIVGRTIRFISSRGSADTFSSSTAVTNAQGQASVTVRSGTAGVATFTCRDETAGVDLPASVQVTFTPVSQRRPVIDSVRTSLGVQGPFLEEVPLENTITVRVADWGDGAPGRVEFRLPNGTVRTVTPTNNEASLTLDMGRDLGYAPNGQWNTVRIVAYNAEGVASEVREVHLLGLSLPPSLWRDHWLREPVVSILVSGGEIRAAEIRIKFVLKWPSTEVDAVRRVPYMGHTYWGHQSNYFIAELELIFQAARYGESTTISGRAEFRAGREVSRRYTHYGRYPTHFVHFLSVNQEVSGGIRGQIQFAPRLRLEELSFFFAETVRSETTDILPVLIKICCAHLSPCCALHPITHFVDLFGRFVITGEGAIVFYDDGQFGFRDSELTLNIGAALVLSVDRRWQRFVYGEVLGGGNLFVRLQFPGSSCNAGFFGVPFLNQVGAEFSVQGQVYIPFVRIEADFNLFNRRWVYPRARCGFLGSPCWLQSPIGEWRPPLRLYLYREPYHQLVAGNQFFPQDDNWDVREEQLIQNVFPTAEPALTWKDGNAIIVYVYDDPNLPPHQSTEIRALMQQSDGSWQDVPITQDTALDSQPRVAVDANGNLIAVWTRMENVDPDPDPNLRLPKGEIAYAVYNAQTGSWSAPVLLTQDDRLDAMPQLVRGADGQLYLVWLKSPDNVLPTDLSRPSLPHTDIWVARWDGTAFVEAQRAIERADTMEAALAVSSRGVPILVWSRDADGNPSTQDLKLYYSYWDGAGWTSPQWVWGNALPQSSPALAIGANDTPVLYFVRSELPHPEFADHTQEELLVTSFSGSGWREPLSITRDNTLDELEVISHPDGRVSAVWLASSQGVADLWTAVYDPAVGYWSNKVRLTQDEMTREMQVAAAWDPAGNPSAVYLKQQLTVGEREVEDDEGNRYPVQVTVPGRADLYLLSHRPKPDLTILENDLTLEPGSPGPGQDVTIRVRVSNLRAMGARNVRVRFYDGAPDAGGTPIGTVQATPDTIVGGGFGTASLSWRVPTDGLTHVLYARVDPDNAIAETNESNNTASYPIAVLDLQAAAPVVEQYLPDGQVVLRFGVANNSHVSPSGEVRWELRLNSVDGALLAQGATTAPASGQTSPLTFTWRPELNGGRYTLYLIIDPDDRFAESDEANNTASSEIALLPDLVVNPALTTLTLGTGGQAQVATTVQNLGWTEASNIVVQVLDAPPGLGAVLASASVPALARYASESVQLNFVLPRTVRQIWVAVNPEGAIQEVRLDNNSVSLLVPWVPGDVNGDGCVDDADLLAIMFAFGQSSGLLPEDVDRSGVVDDADLLAVLFAFGQTGIRREDVNRDGTVDDADLLAVLFAFGQSSRLLPEDLNGDGIVDDADLLEVLFNFGSGC
jgi:hypothetical protein